ncbi:MAG: arylesterase, partial [Candidatus Poseidoniia archaeon]|nr:arylesterase [Candidatus Poseidoniia archaeon]
MKNILCFGDSNTWGYSPLDGRRYPPDIRWSGVLQSSLGSDYRVIEEGLNGRTNVTNEEERPIRSGLHVL